METHRKHLLLAGSLAIAATALTVTACGGGGPSGPPSATSVLQSDGYTLDSAQTSSLSAILASQHIAVLSDAVGDNGAAVEQEVLVFASAASAAQDAQVQNQNDIGTGITTLATGDVETITGPATAFVSGNSPSAAASPSSAATVTDPNGDSCAALDANGYCAADDPYLQGAEVTDPNGDTCAVLDANGYCAADDPDSGF
jgi:hypothetical protein